ncbi:hypothetical protein K377_02014 [Streptomyces sp. PsTaAH-137]|nr:hypothetical protein K377_02014 [Streptomyces sp. PsTaAH-137]
MGDDAVTAFLPNLTGFPSPRALHSSTVQPPRASECAGRTPFGSFLDTCTDIIRPPAGPGTRTARVDRLPRVSRLYAGRTPPVGATSAAAAAPSTAAARRAAPAGAAPAAARVTAPAGVPVMTGRPGGARRPAGARGPAPGPPTAARTPRTRLLLPQRRTGRTATAARPGRCDHDGDDQHHEDPDENCSHHRPSFPFPRIPRGAPRAGVQGGCPCPNAAKAELSNSRGFRPHGVPRSSRADGARAPPRA